jgi:hypothetical protein
VPFRGWLRRRPDVFVHQGQVLGADVDWDAIPWPEPGGCDRRRILQALRAVVEPHRRDWNDPITMMEYTVGNGHSGTVYPAALAMIGQLLIVVEHYPGLPRQTALQILADWWGGYAPERGLESYVDRSGTRIALLPAMAQRIADAAGLFAHIVESDPDSAAAAQALLTVIPLGWGHEVDDGKVHHWGGRVDPDGSVHFPPTGTDGT